CLCESQGVVSKNTARDEDAARRFVTRDQAQQLAKRFLLDPLAAVMLALDKPGLSALRNDDVHAAVRGIASDVLGSIAASREISLNEVFELSPPHRLDVSHRLMELQKFETSASHEWRPDSEDRRQVEP